MIFLAQVRKSNECGRVSSNEIFNVNFDFFFFGICSAPKLSKYIISLPFTSHIILSNELLLIHTHQDLLCMPYPLF